MDPPTTSNPLIHYKGPYSPQYYKKLASSRKYYAAHKDEIAKRNKQYREENKEKIAEYRKQYDEKNKDKVAEYQKQYHETNKSQIADYQSQYYQNHKDEYNAKKRANTSLRKLLKYKHETLQDLKNNPHQPMAKRMLHKIKTGQIDFSLDGGLSEDEIQSLYEIKLPPIPSPQKRKYQGSSRQNHYRDLKFLRKQTDYLNKKFSIYDPNRYLPLVEIKNYNYDYSYLPQREIFKIKNKKRESLHEKWDEEYKKYYEEVKKISNDDKINFLKSVNYF